MKWRHPCLGGQFVKWDTIFEDLPISFAKITKFSLEHPECFYLPDNEPNFKKYFPLIYKEGINFSQILTIIFSNGTPLEFSLETLEEYKLNAAKFFFRTACVQTCHYNLDANSRKIISKIMANVYLNCAYGFKVEGKVFGFTKFEKNGKTFCNFTQKTPILKETIIEMAEYTNIILKPEGVYCLLRPKESDSVILPNNWENLQFDYIK